METLRIMPTEKKFVIIELPPELKKGSGMPVIGVRPMHMPTFSIKWKPIIAVKPITNKETK